MRDASCRSGAANPAQIDAPSRARSRTEGVASGFSPSWRTGPAPEKALPAASRFGTAGFGGTGVCNRTGVSGAGAGRGLAACAAAGTGFSSACSSGEPPSISRRTSSDPTAIFSPTSPLMAMTLPARDEGISTVALSVMTAARRSSSRTTSPTFTCHSTSSASATPSPTSGSLIVKCAICFAPQASMIDVSARPTRSGPGK